MAELGDRLARAERATAPDRKAAEAPRDGLVDVEPAPGRVDFVLVGEAEAVGHDPSALLIVEHDVAVGDALAGTPARAARGGC